MAGDLDAGRVILSTPTGEQLGGMPQGADRGRPEPTCRVPPLNEIQPRPIDGTGLDQPLRHQQGGHQIGHADQLRRSGAACLGPRVGAEGARSTDSGSKVDVTTE